MLNIYLELVLLFQFEEGASPLSDIRDKERQTSPTSGFQFEWLPGNPEDIADASGKTESGESSEKTTEEAEGKSSSEEISSSTPTSTQTDETSESSTSSGTTPTQDNTSTMNEGLDPDSGKMSESKDDSVEEKPDSNESEGGESQTNGPESDGKESEGKEESAEAAGSAPYPQEVAPTEANGMYLPPFPMQNLPLYNLPSTQPQAQDSDRPTVIYASQNFYNPWQWFGAAARVQREEPQREGPPEHYMTGLGYIIVPRPQE